MPVVYKKMTAFHQVTCVLSFLLFASFNLWVVFVLVAREEGERDGEELEGAYLSNQASSGLPHSVLVCYTSGK